MNKWFKRDIFSYAAHFLAGALTIFIVIINFTLPFILLFIFVIYEIIEDKEIHDNGYKDLWAYMLGIYISAFIILILYT